MDIKIKINMQVLSIACDQVKGMKIKQRLKLLSSLNGLNKKTLTFITELVGI